MTDFWLFSSHARRKRVLTEMLNDNVITDPKMGAVDLDFFHLRLQSGNAPDMPIITG